MEQCKESMWAALLQEMWPLAALRTRRPLLAHHLVPQPSAAATQSTFLTTHRGTLPSSCVTCQADSDWALGEGAKRLHRWPLLLARCTRYLLDGSGGSKDEECQETRLRQNTQKDAREREKIGGYDEKEKWTGTDLKMLIRGMMDVVCQVSPSIHQQPCLPSLLPFPHPFLYVTYLSLLFCSSTCFHTSPYIAVGVPALLLTQQLHLS